jgi:5,10-methenyltetrahydrofolate synthetase
MIPSDSPKTANSRQVLRRSLIEQRLEMDEALYRQSCEAITTRLSAHLASLGPRILGFYWQSRREYDPLPLALQVIGAGGSAALPAVVAKGQPLEFRPWHPDVDMMVGLYEIPHPSGGAEIVPDIILLPMVGFDRAGYRLGYGGGYYDRTLAHNSPMPVTIGIGFDFSRLDSIDPQPHDIPMDFVVTETGLFQAVDGALRLLA